MAAVVRGVSRSLRAVGAWWAQRSRIERIVLLAAMAYALAMSVLTVVKIYALRAYAWDLGAFSQALYTTDFQGRFLYYTADLPNNPSGSFFGAHFTPFLLLFLPVYAVLPSPATLVVVQTIALALGAPLVYRLAFLKTGQEPLAGVLAFAYLLSPVIQGVNWFDFHLEAFLIPFLLLAILSWEQRAWRRFAVAIALALSTMEMAGAIVATLAVFWILLLVLASRPRRSAWRSREFRIAGIVLGVSLVWLWIGLRVIASVNPGNALLSGGTSAWEVLGASSILGVPFAALANPGRLVTALATDGWLKGLYLLLLFVPLALLPLRRPICLVLYAPWVAVALASNFPPYYSLGNQYGAFVVPFLFYGAVLGVERHLASRRARPSDIAKPSRSVPIAFLTSSPGQLLALAVVFQIVASPMGPVAAATSPAGGFPVLTDHVTYVHRLADLVPANASILTQNNLFPLFANRVNAYVIPHTTFFAPGNSFNATLDAYINVADYVFVDLTSSRTEALVVLQAMTSRSGFTVLGAADGAILLARNPPVFMGIFVPFAGTYGARELGLRNGTIVSDSAALEGVALAHDPGMGSEVWNGPGVFLAPGQYRISFRLRTNASAAGPVLTLAATIQPGYIRILPKEVSSHGEGVSLDSGLASCTVRLESWNLTAADFGGSAAYQTFSFPFVANAYGLYSFVGGNATGTSSVYLDRISVVEEVPLGALSTLPCPP